MNQQTQRLGIVALLILCLVLSLQTCFKKVQQVSDLKDVVNASQDTVKKWKDKAGNEHAQKVLVTADVSLLKAVYQKQIDSITDLLNIKQSQLEAYTGVSLKNSGSIRPKVDTITLVDSSKEYQISYSDRWLSLSGKLGKDPLINYAFTDSLTVTVYHKRKNLFSRSQTYIDVVSLNPNVTVTGLTGFRIPVKKPGRFGVGPYFGYGYSDGKWQPSAGISIQYSLIRF
ncbi:hypothetical protein QTN47_17120 [Danxiaibacter flavus]|uniref:Uncharacterized protein n=1 Tax=Danxiaibacter flavus TaxID=3049108 RepID=A0ABV3ZJA9_9BACT|nr:hypothetical protein QNM32_17130 [Chitinophagaceae bacterium DXS]